MCTRGLGAHVKYFERVSTVESVDVVCDHILLRILDDCFIKLYYKKDVLIFKLNNLELFITIILKPINVCFSFSYNSYNTIMSFI